MVKNGLFWKITSKCQNHTKNDSTTTLVPYRKQQIIYRLLGYKEGIKRGSSGRGASASYRTMFPEISAQWSLEAKSSDPLMFVKLCSIHRSRAKYIWEKKTNYQFVPTSLFRGRPLIRGFNENKLYHRLYTV